MADKTAGNSALLKERKLQSNDAALMECVKAVDTAAGKEKKIDLVGKEYEGKDAVLMKECVDDLKLYSTKENNVDTTLEVVKVKSTEEDEECATISGEKEIQQIQAEAKNMQDLSVLQLNGLPANISREEMKTALEEKESKVWHIYFNDNHEKAWVYFQEMNAEKPLLVKLKENKLKLKEVCVKASAVDKAKADTFLKKAVLYMARRQSKRKPQDGCSDGQGPSGELKQRKKGDKVSKKKIENDSQEQLAKNVKAVEN